MKDWAFWGRGRNNSDRGDDLRGWEFLGWDHFVWNEGFKRWVLKGRDGGPIFFVKMLAAKGFLGEFKEGIGDWGVRWGSIVLLDCEEGVVDIVQGSIQKDEVGGVMRGEEGDISVSLLDCLVGGGGILFVKSVEFRPGSIGGSGGGH
jgi:hypothetical protein